MPALSQKADALLAAEKEPGAQGLLDKIELEIQSRGIPEGDPMGAKSEAELLAALGQLSGMLAPGMGEMLTKLLKHWDESGGAEGAEEIQAELAGAMNENEELKQRCEALAAAAAAAASGADDAADPE